MVWLVWELKDPKQQLRVFLPQPSRRVEELMYSQDILTIRELPHKNEEKWEAGKIELSTVGEWRLAASERDFRKYGGRKTHKTFLASIFFSPRNRSFAKGNEWTIGWSGSASECDSGASI